jgi:hypothetical protein
VTIARFPDAAYAATQRDVMLPTVQSIIHAEGVPCRDCVALTRTMSGSNSESKVRFADNPGANYQKGLFASIGLVSNAMLPPCDTESPCSSGMRISGSGQPLPCLYCR